jgi:hypothetical protein
MYVTVGQTIVYVVCPWGEQGRPQKTMVCSTGVPV